MLNKDYCGSSICKQNVDQLANFGPISKLTVQDETRQKVPYISTTICKQNVDQLTNFDPISKPIVWHETRQILTIIMYIK